VCVHLQRIEHMDAEHGMDADTRPSFMPLNRLLATNGPIAGPIVEL